MKKVNFRLTCIAQKCLCFSSLSSLQCRRILGGRKLVHLRIIVTAIFDFMTEVYWGVVQIVTLRVVLGRTF